MAVKVSPRVVSNRKSKENAIPPVAPKKSGGEAAASESSKTDENVAKSQMCSMQNNKEMALETIEPETLIDKSPRESKNSNGSDTAMCDHERDTIPCEFINNSIDKGSTETEQLDPASSARKSVHSNNAKHHGDGSRNEFFKCIESNNSRND